jgi:hypothetical protein
MIWEGKRLSEVTEQDLRGILESGVEEHKHLDYKAELYLNNDAGQKDFLIDVCAFANAEGGILLIGVPELRDPENDQPTGAPDLARFEGIPSPNPESVLVSYDSRVVSCIEERLSLETHAIRLGNGRCVFAIRVPNSLNKPHCVRRDEKRYFPSRRDRHIYYMDVQEIKELVMKTASRQEQAEQLLLEAMKEVHFETDMPYLIIGTMPVFWKNFLVDLRNQQVLNAMRFFDLADGTNLGRCDFSFKGVERQGGNPEDVTQLRRSGLVRYSQKIPSRMINGIPAFFPAAIDMRLRSFIKQVAGLYEVTGVSGPFILGMMISTQSLANGLFPDILGTMVVRGQIQRGLHPFPIVTAYDFRDIDSIMRPLCDQAHQAFGEHVSPKFGADGKWIERD